LTLPIAALPEQPYVALNGVLFREVLIVDAPVCRRAHCGLAVLAPAVVATGPDCGKSDEHGDHGSSGDPDALERPVPGDRGARGWIGRRRADPRSNARQQIEETGIAVAAGPLAQIGGLNRSKA